MTATPAAGGRCPFGHGADVRKTNHALDDVPGIELRDGVWHLRTFAAVRQVLKDSEGVRQGIVNDNPLFTRLRQPVIFQDGAAHREQRTAIARFFTPKTVGESYQGFIETFTDDLLAGLLRDGRADLSVMSLHLASEVAARVVGLTDSRRPGMAGRLDRLLAGDVPVDGAGEPGPLRRGAKTARSLAGMLEFYLTDVRPAIRTRRRTPREDVISHLIGKGYNDLEILIECLTYGSAGMATTREFISVAAWHLLEDDALRRSYLAGTQAERHRVLHELLRLEPVASTLWRKAVRDLTVEHGGRTFHIPAGATMVLDIRTANADPATVGEGPTEVCPHRPLPAGVQVQAVSFGDGPHRCPGAFLAIEESDLFLRRLLALPLRIVRPPQVGFNDNLKSYEVRDFELALVSPGAQASAGA